MARLTKPQIWALLPNRIRIWLRLQDIMLNLKFGGERETISERLAKARNKGHWAGIQGCRILDEIDPGHCDRALQFPTNRG